MRRIILTSFIITLPLLSLFSQELTVGDKFREFHPF
jgi:hypothetical protein